MFEKERLRTMQIVKEENERLKSEQHTNASKDNQTEYSGELTPKRLNETIDSRQSPKASAAKDRAHKLEDSREH